MLKEKITVGEAVALINDSILNFEDGLPSADISAIIYAINNEIQIRDYLLGLPATFPIENCQAFMSYIYVSVYGADRYSVDTVNAAYFFETGDIQMSVMLLATALDTKSDYSLALLLKRVVETNWEPSSFRQMREELHGKVVAGLEEMQDQLI